MLKAEHAGCWFDCARGIYIGQEVIWEAQSYGWKPEGLDEETEVSPDMEFYHELTDEAEQYLNSICPTGYWIGSNENGDFGMWECEENDG